MLIGWVDRVCSMVQLSCACFTYLPQSPMGEGESLGGQGLGDCRGVGVRDPLQQVGVAPQQRPHVAAADALLRAVLAVVVQLQTRPTARPAHSQSGERGESRHWVSRSQSDV